MRLTHVNKLDPLCKSYIHNLDWGHLGSQWSNVDFHQKCYKSSMLYSMTIRIIHVYKLETFYSCCGSQVNQGSFDVIAVKSLVWCPPLQHIKLSMVSCWMGDNIKLSKVSSWLGDHISRRNSRYDTGFGNTWRVSAVTSSSEQLSRVQRYRSKVAKLFRLT